jgi:salicylate hydroxylase
MGAPVVIAGAGIGGLSAALALARAGRKVIVIERAPALSEVGAGLQLAPNATRRLDQWDALEPLRADAFAPEKIQIYAGLSGRPIADLPVGEAQKRWGAPYWVAHRADLVKALAHAAARQTNIELRLGKPLNGWRETPECIEIDMPEAAPLRAAALIGADGVRSRVRAGLHLRAGDQPVATGRTAWRALLPAAKTPAALLGKIGGLRLGPGAHLVHYPLRGASVLNIVAVINDEWRGAEDDEWSAQGDHGWLKTRFQDWSDDVRALIAAAPEWRRWPLYVRSPLRAWNVGRVSLLGDAAHAMAPFLAQGAAQAIEDADALGKAFQAHGDDAPKALAVYSAARHARAARVQAASIRQGLIYHMGGPPALARNIAMRALGPQGLAAQSDWIYSA